MLTNEKMMQVKTSLIHWKMRTFPTKEQIRDNLYALHFYILQILKTEKEK